MSEDPGAAIRRTVAEMSPDQLTAALAGITGGGLRSFGSLRPARPVPTVRAAPAEPSRLTVRVDVDGTAPPVWRRLVLHGDLTLEEVHEVLQAALGWEDGHLHQFTTWTGSNPYRAPRFLTAFDLAEGEEGVAESEVRLDQVLSAPGDRVRYLYDSVTTGCTGSGSRRWRPWPPGRRGPCAWAGGWPDRWRTAGGPGVTTISSRPSAPVPACPAWTRTGATGSRRAGTRPCSTWTRWRCGWPGSAVPSRRGGAGGPGKDPGPVGPGGDAGLPAGVAPLLEIAPPAVAAEIARQCARARAADVPALTPQDCEQIARPYRFLVELAGEEGIPLTGAGWMKPACVERIYRELGLDADWIGKGNREDQTLPVAELRAMCQQLGLLRKHKGRLVQSPLARSLTTDQEYVEALAGRLLRHRDRFVGAAITLFAALTAATGRPDPGHAEVIASLMTASGLRTGPGGVDRQAVVGWVRPVRRTLWETTGRPWAHPEDEPHPGDHRAVALARMALWPGP